MLQKGMREIVLGILQTIMKQKSLPFKNLPQVEGKNDRSLHTM